MRRISIFSSCAAGYDVLVVIYGRSRELRSRRIVFAVELSAHCGRMAQQQFLPKRVMSFHFGEQCPAICTKIVTVRTIVSRGAHEKEQYS